MTSQLQPPLSAPPRRGVLPAVPLLDALTVCARQRDRQSVNGLLPTDAWERTVQRARASGWLNLDRAEWLCDAILGRHPREVYGQAWDLYAAAAAGRPVLWDARRHGGVYLYQCGCRCFPCTEANTAAGRRWRRRVVLQHRQPRQHGTKSAYTNYGCRCEACRNGAAAFYSRTRSTHPASVDGEVAAA